MPNLIDLLHDLQKNFGKERITVDDLLTKVDSLGKAPLRAIIERKKGTVQNLAAFAIKIRPNTIPTIKRLINKEPGDDTFVSYSYLNSKKPPTAKDAAYIAFLSILLKFEHVPPGESTFAEHLNQLPDGQYAHFSKDFTTKHVAETATEAKAKAATRSIQVDTLLLPDQALLFDAEVAACQEVLQLLIRKYRDKHDSYLGKNKMVKGIIVCSARQYVKQSCTDATGFEPNPYNDRMYYGIAAVPTADPAGRVVCSHYAPRKELFQQGANPPKLKVGYKMVNIDKLLPADRKAAITAALGALGGPVEIYTSFATII
jgi:hypothetical protein